MVTAPITHLAGFRARGRESYDRSASRSSIDRRYLWLALSIVWVWVFWALALNTGQFGDNVEQANWSQSGEWGYHKHPPLPTWALRLVSQAIGASPYWASTLAGGSLTLAAVCMWWLGCRLTGPVVASAGVLFWGLGMSFSQRAQLYNHNTVLVALLSATACCVWAATRPETSVAAARLQWLFAGGLAGASVLTKYQAVVPLGGLLVAVVVSGCWRRRSLLPGLALAIAAAASLVAPHVIWLVRHDFGPIRYASEAVVDGSFRARTEVVISFVANQVRLWSPVLLALIVYAVSMRRRRDRAPGGSGDAFGRRLNEVSAWMWGLLGFGLIVLLVMAAAFGVSLRNHWGVQATQYLGLLIAWRWSQWRPFDLPRLAVSALVVQTIFLAGYAYEHIDRSAALSGRRIDTMYPARALAERAVRHWADRTGCRLTYVAGTAFDAGLVALYAGGGIQVYDSATATPWILPESLDRHGVLYVLDADAAVPAGLTDVTEFPLVSGSGKGRAAVVRLGIRRPGEACARPR